MVIQGLLKTHAKDVALLVGNGINLFDSPPGTGAWDVLLGQLAKRILGKSAAIPSGISFTEFYDVLELHAPSSAKLQATFCDLMSKWIPRDQHRRIAIWARHHAVPLLTTNFESTLGEAVNCELQRIRSERFTAFYPWSSYFGEENLVDPCTSFAVWHINGMARYRQSVRLGLTHYMGSVGRVRPWFHSGSQRLFEAPNRNAWSGAKTWLQIFFCKPMVIFGLKLAENEVFLRWLFLERARYFKKFPDRRKEAWYIHAGEERDLGKLLFLKAVGVRCVEAKDHGEIYGLSTWALPGAA